MGSDHAAGDHYAARPTLREREDVGFHVWPARRRMQKTIGTCSGSWGFLSTISVEMVGTAGFEPATSWSRTKRASQTALRPEPTFNSALPAGLTRDLPESFRDALAKLRGVYPEHFRGPELYPDAYRGRPH